MKKAISVILVTALVLGLTACSNASSKAETSGTETVAETQTASEATTDASTNEKADQIGGESLPEKPESFPDGTITCIVGFSAGGGVDTAARLLLKYAQNYIDVPLVVTNVTGAAGAVAVTQGLSNEADGTTLISIASGALLGDITGAVNYNFFDDLDMVSLQDCVPYALSFRTEDDRFKTPDEFLTYVKDHPGEITVSTSGINNANYFATKSFFEDNDLNVEIISFDGSADAKTAFLGSHVDAFCETLLETKNMVDANQAICVCTFGEENYLDGVQTNVDLGYQMSVTGTFRGYAYKAGTPKEIIDYMSAIFELCEKDPEFIEECKNLGLDKCIYYLNPEEAESFMQEQYDSYHEFCVQQGIAK